MKTHYIAHVHGNNHGYVKNGIPNVLEITYVNKKFYIDNPPKLNETLFPITGLDFSNNSHRDDIAMIYYPFTIYKKFKEIHIGTKNHKNNKGNTKLIRLNESYPPDTKMFLFIKKEIEEIEEGNHTNTVLYKPVKNFGYKFIGKLLSVYIIGNTCFRYGWNYDITGFIIE